MARFSLRRQPPANELVPRREAPIVASGGPHRSIVASGKAIDISDRTQLQRYRQRMAANQWQDAAWVYNASVPILGYCHDYVRDALARVRPFPAILAEESDKPPVPLTKETAPKGLDPEMCDEVLQRLAPYDNYMGQTAYKIDIAGECFVALISDKNEPSGERCQVLSNKEIFMAGDEWRIREAPDDREGVPLTKGSQLWRLWQPDGEYSALPYSHMVRLNLACEQLLLLNRLIKAVAMSRLATTGKIIAIADEFSLETATGDGQAETTAAGDGEVLGDTFFDDFVAAGAAAILDPESASAVMNLIIRGPRDLIKDGINVIDVTRSMEDVLIKLRQEAREEIATGVNLPREIPLGVGESNHWNADQIQDQTWKIHLEPRALGICGGTTSAFYRPALLANKVDPDVVRRCVVWYDPTWFVGTPDLSEFADQALDKFAISLDAYRSARGWTDEDAPDDKEIQMRLAWMRAEKPEPVAPPPQEQPPEDTSAPQEDPKQDVPEDGKDTNAPPDNADAVAKRTKKKKPVVAAGGPERIDVLGHRLVAIERDLRTRLLQLADATLARALDKAGMKVKGKATAARGTARAAGMSREAFAALFDGRPPSEIPSMLGQKAVQSLGLNDQQLLTGALGDMEKRYHALVKRAQQAAARAAAESTGTDYDEDAFDERTQEDRDAGWGILSKGLMALALGLLYNPHPAAPAIGEFDDTALVPTSLIRAALNRAGGAAESAVTDVRVALPTVDGERPAAVIPRPEVEVPITPDGVGATGGPTVLEAFKDELGITVDTYQWVYGDEPRIEFQPHKDLDGETFTSWDDDVLANPDSFPGYDHYFPGDHGGCRCDAVPLFSQGDATIEPPDGESFVARNEIALYREDQPRDHGRFAEVEGGSDTKESKGDKIVPLKETATFPPKVPLPPITNPKARLEAVNRTMEAAVKQGRETIAGPPYGYDHTTGTDAVVWTAERTEMHNQVVGEVLQQAIDKGALRDQEMVLLGGLGGAGKTTTFEKLLDNPDAFIHISPDNFKEELARRGLVDVPEGYGRMEAATLMHEESSAMAKQLQAEAMSRGYNIVVDNTIGNPDAMASRISQARESGYRVTGVMVDTTIDKAVQNVQSRYAEGLAKDPNMARPTDAIRLESQRDPTGEFNSINARVFDGGKDRLDGWVVVDTSGPFDKKAPANVVSSSDGILKENGHIDFGPYANRPSEQEQLDRLHSAPIRFRERTPYAATPDVWLTERASVLAAADAYAARSFTQYEASPATLAAARRLVDGVRNGPITQDALYRLLPDPDGQRGASFVEGATVQFALATFERSDKRILEKPTAKQLLLVTSGPVNMLGHNGEILIGGQFRVEQIVESGPRRIVKLSQL